jgi:hypothetical protein
MKLPGTAPSSRDVWNNRGQVRAFVIMFQPLLGVAAIKGETGEAPQAFPAGRSRPAGQLRRARKARQPSDPRHEGRAFFSKAMNAISVTYRFESTAN